jgi:hypothetical protein
MNLVTLLKRLVVGAMQSGGKGLRLEFGGGVNGGDSGGEVSVSTSLGSRARESASDAHANPVAVEWRAVAGRRRMTA